MFGVGIESAASPAFVSVPVRVTFEPTTDDPKSSGPSVETTPKGSTPMPCTCAETVPPSVSTVIVDASVPETVGHHARLTVQEVARRNRRGTPVSTDLDVRVRGCHRAHVELDVAVVDHRYPRMNRVGVCGRPEIGIGKRNVGDRVRHDPPPTPSEIDLRVDVRGSRRPVVDEEHADAVPEDDASTCVVERHLERAGRPDVHTGERGAGSAGRGAILATAVAVDEERDVAGVREREHPRGGRADLRVRKRERRRVDRDGRGRQRVGGSGPERCRQHGGHDDGGAHGTAS